MLDIYRPLVKMNLLNALKIITEMKTGEVVLAIKFFYISNVWFDFAQESSVIETTDNCRGLVVITTNL